MGLENHRCKLYRPTKGSKDNFVTSANKKQIKNF